MMKKLVLIITIVLLLCVLCSCGSKSEEQNYDNDNAYVVDIQKDNYGNVISRTVYDKIAERTYLYTYTYEYNNGFWECTNVNTVIILRGGTVVYPEE